MTRLILPVLFALVLLTSPAAASDGQPPLLAYSFAAFWHGFKGFWGGVFGTVGGITGVVLLAGLAGIFIITRGKWLK